MKVFNLQCDQGHPFEGWFGSEEDYQGQVARSLLECPLCASKAIQRLPSAPRLNLSQPGASQAAEPAKPVPAHDAELVGRTPQHQAVQALWLKAVQHVLANTEDVGSRFADEARRIHYGEATERGIRGQATRDETQALQDEGIDVFAMPVPAALKGPLQ